MSKEDSANKTLPKRSERIRNLSARGESYRKPDYVYELGLEECRPRSSSTSSATNVSKKYKGFKISCVGGNRSGIASGGESLEIQKDNTKASEGKRAVSKAHFLEVQNKLSQQRIDFLFTGREKTKEKTPAVKKSGEPLHREPDKTTSGALNKHQGISIHTRVPCDNIKQDGHPADRVNKQTIGVKDDATTAERFLDKYGSDFESATSIHITTESSSEEEANMSEYEEQWKKLLADMKVEVKKEVQGLKDTIKQKVKDELQEELKSTKTSLLTCKLQLNEVIGTVVRQDQMLAECKDKIDFLQNQVDRDVLRVSGISESEQENCIEKIQQFWKDKLGITETIPIKEALRIRGGKLRVIKVILANVEDKRKIFKNTSKLKDVVNEFEKPYYVSDQITAKRQADKKRRRQITQQNKSMPIAERLAVSFENAKFTVDGKVYEKQVKPPSCREILMASKETRLTRLEAKITRGANVDVLNQRFIG